jgi:hypothetical protein
MLRQFCMATFVVGSMSIAGAQSLAPAAQVDPASGGPAAAKDEPDVLPDAQLATMLDSYAMFQAQQQLSISDEKFGAFAGRLKNLQDTRRRNQRQRHRIVQDLRRLAWPKSPAPGADASIRAQLAALREHDDRAAAELRQAYDALDAVLDPRQQARYRIFEEQIERRKLDLLVRARETARRNREKALSKQE